MAVLFRCELCDKVVEQARSLALMVDGQPVMVRHYCPPCFVKTQFPVEAFVKRTTQDRFAESAPAQ